MIFVVAFSSCLDVAAIEMEMGTPLDFDAELQTVSSDGSGICNQPSVFTTVQRISLSDPGACYLALSPVSTGDRTCLSLRSGVVDADICCPNLSTLVFPPYTYNGVVTTRRCTCLAVFLQVGWSNVTSGLSGGFTGSYIFSQTIFSLRAGKLCTFITLANSNVHNIKVHATCCGRGACGIDTCN